SVNKELCMNRKRIFSFSRLALAATLAALYWGIHSGRLLWTGSGVRLAAYQAPEGPRAAVHPEVLHLQAAFNQLAELAKPAVVSITTIHTEQTQQMPQFFFGDPFEQFFEQFGNPGGSPYGRPHAAPRQAPKFKLEGMGSGVIIDPAGLVLTNE